jgi:dTMP kinase
MRGKFVTFEGPEGGGKSTACRAVAAAFGGTDILVVREPGSTPLGERIRAILQEEDMPARSELMLFEAARACIVDGVILPALEAGRHVLCDRFCDSTVAYQGFGRGLPMRDVWELNRMATGGLTPDLTIVFDIDPEAGMSRKGKAADRIERAGADFHARVREGFLTMADREPHRFRVIDASKGADEVLEEIKGMLASEAGWRWG